AHAARLPMRGRRIRPRSGRPRVRLRGRRSNEGEPMTARHSTDVPRTGSPRAVAADREIAAAAPALGHPAPVAILRLLLECGDCICGRIVDGMPLAQATVSQHLKVLKETGLVRGEVDGPRVCYCANPEAIRSLGEHLIALADHGPLADVPVNSR